MHWLACLLLVIAIPAVAQTRPIATDRSFDTTGLEDETILYTRTSTVTRTFTLPSLQTNFQAGRNFTVVDQDSSATGRIRIAAPGSSYQILEFTTAAGNDLLSSGTQGDSITLTSLGDVDADGDTDVLVTSIRGVWVDAGP